MAAINYGFECEYFLRGRDGMVWKIPDRFPRDGAQHLVEVRSRYYADPLATLESFNCEWERLVMLARDLGYELVCKDRHEFFGPYAEKPEFVETAGFHIHFSSPQQMDMPRMISELGIRFGVEITNSGRGSMPEPYRMKSHGWEYRMLPATIDPQAVARFLKEWCI